MAFVIQWIDMIWLPMAWFVVNKEQRLQAVAFILGSMVMMRLQVELMSSIGFERGIIGLMNAHALSRGLMVYSLCYMIYLILAYYSPDTKGPIFLAASLSMSFMALFVSTIVMVL